MHAQILKSLALPPYGKPVSELTEAEKLGLYVAAGFPIQVETKTGPNHELLVVTRSSIPFAVADDGTRYVVAVNLNA